MQHSLRLVLETRGGCCADLLATHELRSRLQLCGTPTTTITAASYERAQRVTFRGNCQVTGCGKKSVEVVVIGVRLYCLDCAKPLLAPLTPAQQLELPYDLRDTGDDEL